MKTKLLIGTSLVVGTLFLLSFANRENQQLKRTEEYGQIIFQGSTVEKTANGKTEVYLINVEKIAGQFGKFYNTALINELNKMNEDGYEIVNVSSVSSANFPVKDIYLFKRKL